jgi:hypothetical protein
VKLVWVLRKDGAALQFADNRHASDEVLERYSMDGLAGRELADAEEHLLVCESCQGRLAHEDSIRQGVRDGGAVLVTQPRTAARKLAWAFALAAMVLAVLTVSQWQWVRRSAGPPAVILLQATRGADAAQAVAPAGKPLTLMLDLTGLPQASEYTLEVVDAGGRPAYRSKESPRNNRLQATFDRGLAAGAYFVRVYMLDGELLREYVLPVRG